MELFLVICLCLVMLYAYILYAQIITKKNKALEALSSIDVQLKQRSSLLPNILIVAEKFMTHEKKVFSEITELRTSATQPYNQNNMEEIDKHLQNANLLDRHLSQFMLNVENYPDLKSDKTMIEAMNTNSEIEAQISASRRFYNSSVRELNTVIEIFPGMVIANLIKIKPMPYYKAESAAQTEVNANEYLS